MKSNLKSILLGTIVGVTLSNAVNVAAFDGARNIQAVFKNIQVYVDGNKITPKDSAGKEIEPFIYNGSTYLPLRAIGEAVGKEVTWDGSTNSIYLGKSGTTKYLGQQVTKYQGNACEVTVTMAGERYLNSLANLSDCGISNAYYNLNDMYSYITGVYGMEDGTPEHYEGTISFYGDGRLIETLKVKGGQLPKSFGISVSGVAQLKIEFEGYGELCLGNVEFR